MKKFTLIFFITSIFSIGFAFFDIHNKYSYLKTESNKTSDQMLELRQALAFAFKEINEIKESQRDISEDYIEQVARSVISQCEVESFFVKGEIQYKNFKDIFEDFIYGLDIEC